MTGYLACIASSEYCFADVGIFDVLAVNLDRDTIDKGISVKWFMKIITRTQSDCPESEIF